MQSIYFVFTSHEMNAFCKLVISTINNPDCICTVFRLCDAKVHHAQTTCYKYHVCVCVCVLAYSVYIYILYTLGHLCSLYWELFCEHKHEIIKFMWPYKQKILKSYIKSPRRADTKQVTALPFPRQWAGHVLTKTQRTLVARHWNFMYQVNINFYFIYSFIPLVCLSNSILGCKQYVSDISNHFVTLPPIFCSFALSFCDLKLFGGRKRKRKPSFYKKQRNFHPHSANSHDVTDSVSVF